MQFACRKRANFGRSSRMTSATPVASISRYRRNGIIRYGNRAAICSENTQPRKPEYAVVRPGMHAKGQTSANGGSTCLIQRINAVIRIPSLSRWSITNKLVRTDYKLTGGRKTQRARQGSSWRIAGSRFSETPGRAWCEDSFRPKMIRRSNAYGTGSAKSITSSF